MGAQLQLRAAEQAVKIVQSGDWVDYSQTCSFPTALDQALAGRKNELRDVKVRNAISMRPVQIVEQDPEQTAFTYNLWHCSGIDRKYLDKGMAYHSPMLFRNCGAYYTKGLAPVAGRPFLAWQLAGLARRGITRAVLALGYRAEMIRDTLGERCEGVELDFSLETEPLGTGGALLQAAKRCQTPSILALNGDTFLDFDATAVARALDATAVGVIVLTPVPDIARYGSVEADEGGRVRSFREKGGAGPGWINGGVYALRLPALAPFWPVEPAFSFERAVLPALAAVAASLIPASRAARVDVAQALRSE